MTLAVAVGVLVAAGVFLLSRRGTLRLVLGFVLLGHAVNLIILAAGGASRREPAFIGDDLDLATAADPLPQAFVLTAIVITFGVTVFLLGLAARSSLREEADQDGAEEDGDEVGEAPR
jgi:multicomponent Na+:H+ antiporter subunit C